MHTATKLNYVPAAASFPEVMKYLKEQLFSDIFLQGIKVKR
jgi:hypothetical protein